MRHDDSVLPDDMGSRFGDGPRKWIRASEGMDKIVDG